MKVLLVSDSVFPPSLGGGEVSMHLLLEHLRQRGFEAETCLWRPYAGRPLEEVIEHADPEWVFTRSRVAPDVIREAKRLGRKAALFVDGAGFLREAGRPEARAALAAADLIVCDSEFTRRSVIRALGGVEIAGRIIVQHPLIARPKGAGIRRRRYVTIIGPRPGKGLVVFEELTRRLTDREFLAVGGNRLDVAWERVAFLPVAVCMDEVYRATRILIRPDEEPETFGRTVVEAAAFGVPAVVSGQGGLPEALGPGGIAVSDFRNPDAWVRAMERIEEQYGHYSRLAQEHAQEFGSADVLLDAMEQSELIQTEQGART